MEILLEKFPNWRAEIRQCYEEDGLFREVCADYQEIDTLLAQWTSSKPMSSDIIDEYIDLHAKLEVEIMALLKDRFRSVHAVASDSRGK